jgi:hypothetical protein
VQEEEEEEEEEQKQKDLGGSREKRRRKKYYISRKVTRENLKETASRAKCKNTKTESKKCPAHVE